MREVGEERVKVLHEDQRPGRRRDKRRGGDYLGKNAGGVWTLERGKIRKEHLPAAWMLAWPAWLLGCLEVGGDVCTFQVPR